MADWSVTGTPSIKTNTCRLLPPRILILLGSVGFAFTPLISIPATVFKISITVFPAFFCNCSCVIFAITFPEFSFFKLNFVAVTTTSSKVSTFSFFSFCVSFFCAKRVVLAKLHAKTPTNKIFFFIFFDLIETINQVNFVYELVLVHKLLSRKFLTRDDGQVS